MRVTVNVIELKYIDYIDHDRHMDSHVIVASTDAIERALDQLAVERQKWKEKKS